ncbi:acetyl/propionyl/methylcrotonyl-CoA carboxylase subunit alpha [Labrys sp. ZIDIC5]|uniref:acetyl/propionyl/methylcrotonyl-CoA carboxylase subunit alpha n=1 Tax=Labrys sedimenti TaxID=3106036 RepID=UPI002ACAFEA2|nr:biotin carboxylase N-terminal domain-containing protein [Labrys sp. ZIDIC5]MDZ5448871.1 biotin carboxylase N-terminal domain-containing protein [Labrys sp. ZIDIC5]
MTAPQPRPIRVLLIANRGEIAVRIIRTARAMGIRTVAVYSDADADSLAVSLADRALRIGPAPSRESYLSIEKLIAAAKASGADAIHPGYGFLAENAEFARACAAADITFVGPSAETILAMGDKAQARSRMAAAGVPVLSGYEGEDQGVDTLVAAAEAIGFPVLLKPSAGGGGKGMHIVRRVEDMPAALLAAQREARSSFGDDRMVIERYLQTARHVEVQVFADHHGNTVHLFDRDCSVQRRHQKVIEEAPAPDLPPALRAGLHQAAITCAQSVDYVGAGTVEFLVADDHFYFMEMNTRLQVEHPVTEAVTGLDLVSWQLRVAGGAPLPLAQEAIACTGHALEARLCAEDPAGGFLPSIGRIEHLVLPDQLPGIRVDSGFRSGDTISMHYDSLLAKVIAVGADRVEAIARLGGGLDTVEVVGPHTNRDFLAAIIRHPAFAESGVDTRFIEHHQADLLASAPHPSDEVVAAAAFVALGAAERQAKAADPADPHSPWGETGGWRLSGSARRKLDLAWGEALIGVDAVWRAGGYELRLGDRLVNVEGSLEADGTARLRIGEGVLKARAALFGETLTLFVDGRSYAFVVHDPRKPRGVESDGAGRILSPMPGLVLSVNAVAGETVEKGQPLVVIEAMKMEHTVSAPRTGVVKVVDVAVGDQVVAGAELVVLEVEP